MSSGLKDLMAVAAPSVQNTYDKSHPFNKKKSMHGISVEK